MAALERSALYTANLLERIDLFRIPSPQRPRLSRLLLRIERVAGEAHDLIAFTR